MDENLKKQAELMAVIDREAAAYKHAFGYTEWRSACEVCLLQPELMRRLPTCDAELEPPSYGATACHGFSVPDQWLKLRACQAPCFACAASLWHLGYPQENPRNHHWSSRPPEVWHIPVNMHSIIHSMGSNWTWNSVQTASQEVRRNMASFKEVRNNMSEGLRFYMSLQEAIAVLAQQAGDYILTRRLQR